MWRFITSKSKLFPGNLQFLNCGASANVPVSGPHEPFAISYTVLDVQLPTASGLSVVTLNASLQEWLKSMFTELGKGHKWRKKEKVKILAGAEGTEEVAINTFGM